MSTQRLAGPLAPSVLPLLLLYRSPLFPSPLPPATFTEQTSNNKVNMTILTILTCLPETFNTFPLDVKLP